MRNLHLFRNKSICEELVISFISMHLFRTEILRQFSIEINDSFKANKIPMVSSEELNHLAKAITFIVNRVCTSKRNYRMRLNVQDVLPQYGLLNQCDFYYPNPAKAKSKLLSDPFKEAFTPLNQITQEFKISAKRIYVSIQRNRYKLTNIHIIHLLSSHYR